MVIRALRRHPDRQAARSCRTHSRSLRFLIHLILRLNHRSRLNHQNHPRFHYRHQNFRLRRLILQCLRYRCQFGDRWGRRHRWGTGRWGQ